HSLSAAFQQAGFDALGLPFAYTPWETPADQVAAAVAALRQGSRVGMNVTAPYKETVLPLLDRIDSQAARIGAVNTIVRGEDGLTGYNTDAPGFLRSLTDDAGFQPAGARVLLLGAGGAARAVAFGLADAGAVRIVIVNRGRDRAEHLAASVAAGGAAAVSVIDWTAEALTAAAAASDLIVNSTSVGMLHSAGEGQSPLDGCAIPAGVLVADLVYNPQRTPLLVAAEVAGARTLGGLPMLIYQGAAAFRLWTGVEAPVAVMMQAALRVLSS
ncbi:MAG: shikimate dehydrogenase, partial [Chloroflexi bacterium]|nr:shikimate dehydrogenase [Chloroflexota bacterium]